MINDIETLAFATGGGRTTPWGGRGNAVEGLMTAQQALQSGGLDWDVRTELMTLAGTDILIPNRYATVRSSDNKPLGIVGNRYQVLQNREAFDWADSLVDSGEAKYEQAGSIKGGSRVFLNMELDHLEIRVPGDSSAMKTYLMVATSHDGSLPTGAFVHHVRIVCMNTWKAAMSSAQSAFRVRHTSSMEGKLAMAREALQITFENTEAVQQIATRLAKAKMTDRKVDEAYRTIWPSKDKGDVSRNAERAFENYMTSDTLVDIRGNAWGALNGITEFLDHLVTYKASTNEGDTARADALLFGTGAETKDRALQVLTAATRR